MDRAAEEPLARGYREGGGKEEGRGGGEEEEGERKGIIWKVD